MSYFIEALNATSWARLLFYTVTLFLILAAIKNIITQEK